MQFLRAYAGPNGIAVLAGAVCVLIGLASCGEPAAPPLAVRILVSRFGDLVAEVPSGATCHAEVRLPGDQKRGHPLGGATILDGAGSRMEWTYSTPGNVRGTGTHVVTCTKGAASGSASSTFALISADHD